MVNVIKSLEEAVASLPMSFDHYRSRSIYHVGALAAGAVNVGQGFWGLYKATDRNKRLFSIAQIGVGILLCVVATDMQNELNLVWAAGKAAREKTTDADVICGTLYAGVFGDKDRIGKADFTNRGDAYKCTAWLTQANFTQVYGQAASWLRAGTCIETYYGVTYRVSVNQLVCKGYI